MKCHGECLVHRHQTLRLVMAQAAFVTDSIVLSQHRVKLDGFWRAKSFVCELLSLMLSDPWRTLIVRGIASCNS